jgi:hydrogenase-1 operon protein HyaF
VNARDAIAVPAEIETGNVMPLLHEIRHALERLARGEPGTVIDLKSLPLAPGEESKIEAALGEGELRAELDALGPTTIIETSYPGVWLITHRNTENEVIGRLIEVTEVPAILKSQQEDVRAALRELQKRLSGKNGDRDELTQAAETEARA